MAPRSSFFLHPLNFTCGLGALFVAVWTLAYVPHSYRLLRVLLGLAVLSLCLTALSQTDRGSHEGQSFAEAMFGLGLHAFNKLALEKPMEHAGKEVGWRRMASSLSDLFTFRRRREGGQRLAQSSTTTATKVGQLTSPSSSSTASSARSRSNGKRTKPKSPSPPQQSPATSTTTITTPTLSWRLQRLVKATLQLSLFWYMRSHSLIPGLRPTYADFVAPRSLLLSLLTGTLDPHAFLVRLDIVATSLIMPSLVLCAAHNLSAALLASSAAPTASWPGLYGPLPAAYSVGRWYSHFWHTLMRHAFTLPARLVARRLLRLDPASGRGRAAITMLAFLISGVMHVLTSWAPGPCQDLSWMELWWHLATGAVILVERAVVDAYVGWRARTGDGKLGVWEARCWRAVGYVWTATWWLDGFGAGVLWPWIRCRARAAARG